MLIYNDDDDGGGGGGGGGDDDDDDDDDDGSGGGGGSGRCSGYPQNDVKFPKRLSGIQEPLTFYTWVERRIVKKITRLKQQPHKEENV